METTLYEYYDHSIMSEVNREFTPELIKELKSFMVERYVDNMETKDLVEYVTDDLDRYYDKMDDKQFLDEASDYWEDHFSDVIDEVVEYAKCDFKKDRIVPDVIKSLKNESKILLRNPNATRPWQHVLEPLSGYLKLGHKLIN